MKISRIITAVLVTACLIVMAVPFTASAAWDGASATTAFASGDGTEASPYVIASENDLAFLAKSCNEGEKYDGKYFRLMTDLDLGGKPWTPIGNSNTVYFAGIFDGGGFTVSGLKIEIATNYAGLFGCITNGTVKNLNVTASTVYSPKYSGVLAGQLTVSGGNVLISNCHVSADMINGEQMGGICGRISSSGATAESVIVSGCSSTVNTETATGDAIKSMSNSFAGGIVGAAGGCTIQYCWSVGGVISCGSDIVSNLILSGGIVGCQGASSAVCNIFNCYSTNEVKVVGGALAAGTCAGGLVGRASHVTDGEIANCFASGKASNVKDSTYAGTLIGHVRNYVSFDNCYATGDTAIGVDELMYEYPVTKITESQLASAGALTEINLAKGNTAAVWAASTVDGHPVIDLTKIEGNTFTYRAFDYVEETTTDPSATTAAPGTTAAPDTTAAPGTTAAPDTTAAPASPETTAAPGTSSGGCGSVAVILPVTLIALVGAAVIKRRR